MGALRLRTQRHSELREGRAGNRLRSRSACPPEPLIGGGMALKEVWNHPKFRRLKARLGLRSYETIGVLESVWSIAVMVKSCRAGDIPWSSADIADFIEWGGDPVKLTDALVSSGWLDGSEGAFHIHDWMHHAPAWIKGHIASASASVSDDSKTDTKPLPKGGAKPTPKGGAKQVIGKGMGMGLGSSEHQDSTQNYRIKINTSTWKFEGIEDSDTAAWTEAFPLVAVPSEVAKCEAWVKANWPKSRRSSWARSLFNWLNKAQRDAERTADYARAPISRKIETTAEKSARLNADIDAQMARVAADQQAGGFAATLRPEGSGRVQTHPNNRTQQRAS